MNKAVLVGRLTRDPELKTSGNGISLCQFTIAVNRRYKNADGGYDADFINCIAWRGTAEFLCKYFEKGSMVGVAGSIQTRSYEKNGNKLYITEVLAEEVGFISGSGKAKAESRDDNNNTIDDIDFPADMPQPDDDDLPF